MANALYVTTKVFCKRALVGALSTVGILVLGPLMIRIMFWLQGARTNQFSHDLTGFYFSYLFFSATLFLSVCYLSLQGTKKVTFGLPISSKSIASWLMFATVGLVIMLQFITNGAYRLLFFDENWLNSYWPLLGPLLFMTMIILVGHSIYWSMHAPSITKLFFWIGLVVALFWWFIARYFPNGFYENMVLWIRVTLWDSVTILLVSVAAWFQGTWAYGRVRSGTAVPSRVWALLNRWWNELETGMIFKGKSSFSSAQASLARFHWDDSCRRTVIITGVAFGISIVVLNITLRSTRGTSPIRQAESLQLVAMIFTYFAGMIVPMLQGEQINGPGRTGMKLFLAMAPLSDRDFSLVLFRNMLKTLVACYVLIQLSLLLSFFAVALIDGRGILHALASPGFLINSIPLRFILPFVSFWIISSNVISVYWTGRTWLYNTALIGFFGWFGLLVAITVRTDGPYQSQIDRYLLIGLFLSTSFLVLGGTVTAYVIACRKKLIKVSTAVIAFLIWLIGVSLTSYFQYQTLNGSEGTIRLFALLFFISMSLLAVTPFATIPLALTWNRHR